MSTYVIYYFENLKLMRPVLTATEYRNLRNSERQKLMVDDVRKGDASQKHNLLQFNYSCIPGLNMKLKGCTVCSNSVGMDIDHIAKEQMAEVRERILQKKDELGLLMLELSARGEGYHLVFRRRPGLSQEENLQWASNLLDVEFDKGAKDITRVFFSTTASPDDLIYLHDDLFINEPMKEGVIKKEIPSAEPATVPEVSTSASSPVPTSASPSPFNGEENGGEDPLLYEGIPYDAIIRKYWEMSNDGNEPHPGNRNTLTFELACLLRNICGYDRNLLAKVIPNYWAEDGEAEKMKCIDSALQQKPTKMPKQLRAIITELKKENVDDDVVFKALEAAENEDELFYYNRIPQEALPQGISESVKATGNKMIMPVIAACCPAIGALATDVKLLVHGKETKLNMHSFIVGDAASCKGDLDNVVEAWMAEEMQKNTLYFEQEAEYRTKKKAAKNAKEQPEEPHLPVRFLTMNNTVANLAERLANTDGKHAFSFTPEADTVAQKWRSSMCDFSTMLRQSYDGSRYDREAKSAEATTVHIDHLLWNVCMCGTPDALYRVISNYTDGLLSRFIIAHTPDNTFAPLDETPALMTDKLRDRIIQVAHLLPLMQGTLKLDKLEACSRQWVEKVRREALKDDDRVMARARLRDHGTAMRMTACLILCAVAEKLIEDHGLTGAEKMLQMQPWLTAEMASEMQTPAMLQAYEVLAESLIDNDMIYFRDKLEQASATTVNIGKSRARRGGNDIIYNRLPAEFSFEQAMGAKGNGCSRNSVHQMLKNWKSQKLITQTDDCHYQKIG